jgi:uncharacterized protein (DUF302 family)
MTGAVAVVMASLGGASRAAATSAADMQTRTSRYDVAQTAELIESTARRHGFSIFVRARQSAVEGERVVETLVLVLESPHGGTPVLMRGEGDELRPQLPLRLEVFPRRDGASEVRFPVAFHPDMGDVPETLAAAMMDLDALVADALA